MSKASSEKKQTRLMSRLIGLRDGRPAGVLWILLLIVLAAQASTLTLLEVNRFLNLGAFAIDRWWSADLVAFGWNLTQLAASFACTFPMALGISIACRTESIRLHQPGMVLLTVLGTIGGDVALCLLHWQFPAVVLVQGPLVLCWSFADMLLFWAVIWACGCYPKRMTLLPEFKRVNPPKKHRRIDYGKADHV